MVVVAMHYIYELLSSFAFGNHMECPAVHDVFKKCPEKHTCNKQNRDSQYTEFKIGCRVIAKSNHYRQVDPPDHQRMGLGEKLQSRVLKQLRLSFIMNFLKL